MATRFRAPLAALTLIPVALLAAACGSGGGSKTSSTHSSPSSTAGAAAMPTAPASSKVSLSETGSTLLYPLFNLWAPGYKKQYSQVTITTAGTGSGTGISDASSGTVNIGASDAYLPPAEKTKNPSLENIPLAISAQQINYNVPGVKQHIKLDGQVLAGMYGGKITNWDNPAIAALNPGVKLPNLKVVPLKRSDSSGDTFLFTSYLSKQVPQWGSSVGFGTTVPWPSVSGELGEKGNSGMVTGCKSNPGCVAYIGISYLSKTTAAGLGQAALKNGAGSYVLPTPTAIKAEASGFASKTPASGTVSMINGSTAGSYPIINYEYGIVNAHQPSATTAQTLKAFLHWAITTGNTPTYLSKVNFQPLPSSVVSTSDALISKIS